MLTLPTSHLVDSLVMSGTPFEALSRGAEESITSILLREEMSRMDARAVLHTQFSPLQCTGGSVLQFASFLTPLSPSLLKANDVVLKELEPLAQQSFNNTIATFSPKVPLIFDMVGVFLFLLF
jgi:hypothetical protein